MRFLLLIAALIVTTTSAVQASAFEDPTKGKPFLPWLWDDQIKPTARSATSTSSLSILLGAAGATVVAHQYDPEVRDEYGDNRHMPTNISRLGSLLGSGGPSIATLTGLLFWDQPEGLKMGRAVLLTSASHITIAMIANRRRPNNGVRAFPSGHTSTSFAVAGSLAYSYGPWVGVPALALASFVGASRIADNAHWLSDTVAAAGLGLFWAHASAYADTDKQSITSGFSPAIVPGGFVMNFSREF